MVTLTFAILWKQGTYSLTPSLEAEIKNALFQRLKGNLLSPRDIGAEIPDIALKTKAIETLFSARLVNIDPQSSVVVDQRTQLQIRLAAIDPEEMAVSKDMQDVLALKKVFDPQQPEAFSTALQRFDRLVGIPKDEILATMRQLLMSADQQHTWSVKYYRHLLPILQDIQRKAPVILLAGDPGTGKTALATSIGAPLAAHLKSRVHLIGINHAIRGEGFHGKAATFINKLFDYLEIEYFRAHEPLLVFFDEAESIVSSRSRDDGSSGAAENTAIVNAVLKNIDALREGASPRIIVMFATNLLGHIDAALLRRSYTYTFERPDQEARRALFARLLQGMNLDQVVGQLVAATSDRQGRRFTFADIADQIVGRAVQEAILDDRPVQVDRILAYCRLTVPSASVVEHTAQAIARP